MKPGTYRSYVLLRNYTHTHDGICNQYILYGLVLLYWKDVFHVSVFIGFIKQKEDKRRRSKFYPCRISAKKIAEETEEKKI